MATGEYDVVVVGGAAAGLSGALILARARRSVAVVDSADPRNAPAAHVHNHLGREGASPSELAGVGRGEITGSGPPEQRCRRRTRPGPLLFPGFMPPEIWWSRRCR
ncbi:FAD-binding protein [Arthrobacter zhaoxinii]|uniref:FAD-binding protein n=1 Tax=Arthrobacter zhaoxinii TaxID=2964616 RepID=UPI0027E2AB5A|nr:FAD-binding protein [Arthrobacter zhaoxinii]